MTYSIPAYAQDGKELSPWILDENVFDDDIINNSLIHEYIRFQRNNGRIAIAHTKTRGEVSGSGKKLFKQKGMGAARVGEKRSPLRKKGGIVFGPRKERNFSMKMNKKMRRKALAGLLVLRVQSGNVLGLDNLAFSDIKTKNAIESLKNLKLASEKTLFVLPELNENIVKSLRNIPTVKYVLIGNMNPLDLASYKKVVFVSTTLDTFTKNLSA